MSMQGRRIILGVTGSIAAYKAAELARNMTRQGALVTVVMTESAQQFIAPLTFRTLTGRPVATSLFSDPASPVPHISLAQWAEIILVAPATADTIARVAHGRADDLLAALILDSVAPVVWAPAMNTRMWDHALTQENIRTLKKVGHHWVYPESGVLACNETGKGRMADVRAIQDKVADILIPKGPLAGKRILITAGPTREPWDGIRFLSNRSTGKMGFALARETQRRGARVTLIAGPVAQETPAGVVRVDVETAQAMYDAAMSAFEESDIVIAAAAVADFAPANPIVGKIKKDQGLPTLSLKKNPDILKEMGANKRQKILVGFAAESENITAAAIAKRKAKNCDLLFANQATGPNDTFASNTAKVYCIDRLDQVEELEERPKDEVAAMICDRIENAMITKNNQG